MSLELRSDVVDLGPAIVLAGTADPTAGAGVAAPEGSLYMRNVTAAGLAYMKTGAADTDWTALGGGGGGAFEIVDRIDPLAAPATTVTFGAGGDGVLQTPLNGDADGIYRLQSYWVTNNITGLNLALHPNAVSADLDVVWQYSTGGGGGGSGSSASDLYIGRTDSSNNIFVYSEVIFYAPTGQDRVFLIDWHAHKGNVNPSIYVAGGQWNNAIDNITTLAIVGGVNQININSRFYLYKLSVTP